MAGAVSGVNWKTGAVLPLAGPVEVVGAAGVMVTFTAAVRIVL